MTTVVNPIQETMSELDHLRIELQNQIHRTNELVVYKEKYQDLVLDYNDINKEYDSLIKRESLANAELKALRRETEELSSELFNEANRMVSHERKKNHKFHEVNKFLKNEANEQKVIIKMYEHQIQSLKDAVTELESENEALKAKIESNMAAINTVAALQSQEAENKPEDINEKWMKASEYEVKKLMSSIPYVPTIQALRYDLKFYTSFMEYVFANQLLLETRSQPDYKDAYFFKRMVVEDIDPTLNFESSPSLSFFQKKTIYSAIFNSAITFEPFSSLEDRNVRIANFAGTENGILVNKHSCSVCGEDRNDTIEHARLYKMKVVAQKQKQSPSLTSRMFMNNVMDPMTANQVYPICNFCLTRVRSVCDLFLFLNTIKRGMYHVSKERETITKGLYVELTRHKTKLFWSRAGLIQSDSLIVENSSFTEKQLSFAYEFSRLFINSPNSPASPQSLLSSPDMGDDSYSSSVSCSPMSYDKGSPISMKSPASPEETEDDFKMIEFKKDFQENVFSDQQATSDLVETVIVATEPVEEHCLAPAPEIVPATPSESAIALEIVSEQVAPAAELEPVDSAIITQELKKGVKSIVSKVSIEHIGRDVDIDSIPDPKSVLSEQEDSQDLDELTETLNFDDDEIEISCLFAPFEDRVVQSIEQKVEQKTESGEFAEVSI